MEDRQGFRYITTIKSQIEPKEFRKQLGITFFFLTEIPVAEPSIVGFRHSLSVYQKAV
jgi:hypothetical protein